MYANSTQKGSQAGLQFGSLFSWEATVLPTEPSCLFWPQVISWSQAIISWPQVVIASPQAIISWPWVNFSWSQVSILWPQTIISPPQVIISWSQFIILWPQAIISPQVIISWPQVILWLCINCFYAMSPDGSVFMYYKLTFFALTKTAV